MAAPRHAAAHHRVPARRPGHSLTRAGRPSPRAIAVKRTDWQLCQPACHIAGDIAVDVADLDLVLPHNAAGLDDRAHDIAAQASAA